MDSLSIKPPRILSSAALHDTGEKSFANPWQSNQYFASDIQEICVLGTARLIHRQYHDAWQIPSTETAFVNVLPPGRFLTKCYS